SFARAPAPASTSDSASVRSPWLGYNGRSRRAMSIWRRRLAASRSTRRFGLTRGFGISAVAWGCDGRLQQGPSKQLQLIGHQTPQLREQFEYRTRIPLAVTQQRLPPSGPLLSGHRGALAHQPPPLQRPHFAVVPL